MMKKHKIIILAILLTLILIGIRTVWEHYHIIPDQPIADNGVLDLRDWNLSDSRSLSLKGEWEYYPSTLLMNEEAPRTDAEDVQFFHLRKKSSLTSLKSMQVAPEYSSYRLRILLNSDPDEIYMIRISNIFNSSELYVDGRLLGHSGKPSANKESYEAGHLPYSSVFNIENGEVEIVIHTANYLNPSAYDFSAPIKFGTQAALSKEVLFSLLMQIIVCAVFLLHIIYALILIALGVRDKKLYYLILVMLAAIGTILLDNDKLLQSWMSLNLYAGKKLTLACYIAAVYFCIQFFRHLFNVYSWDRLLKWYSLVCLICFSIIALVPSKYALPFGNIFLLLTISVLLPLSFNSLRAAFKGQQDAHWLMLALVSLTSYWVGGAGKKHGWLSYEYYPIDVLAAVLAFAVFIFKDYFRNVNRSIMLAEKLQRTDELKDNFLANTSHELRTPLHGIIHMAQNVLDEEKNSISTESAKNLELVVTVGRRMSLLLNDLLDVSKLRDGNVQLAVNRVQLPALVVGVMDMLRFLTEGKQLTLQLNVPDDFPAVMADEKRIIQVLFNVIHNAIKYTDEGSITVSANSHNGLAFIHISDTGIGMDEETQQKIFEPYEQGTDGITIIDSGIGLGLSISRQLVELHGETLSVKSSIGSGSTFTFTLPLAETGMIAEDASAEIAVANSALNAVVSEDRSGSTAGPKRNDENRIKLLAVDDDPVNLKVLKQILQSNRYTLITASNGKAALELLDEEKFDLVIADVMMPQMSGYELLTIIRERYTLAELPVLLLTARSQPEDIHAGFIRGANDYVTKPVHAVELRARVLALTELRLSVQAQLRTEAAYLQAQIQPHFLFNTLNSITSLSEFDLDKMRGLIEAFSSYLRISFNFLNAERFVPLSHEIDLVQTYLYIEKERFDERLVIEWDLDKEIHVMLPPLTIQPIVENSLKHGILTRFEGGTVSISIKNNDSYIEITVSDNGVGMTEEEVHELLSRLPDGNRGIGLINTDRRLKQTYGSGLHITSKPNIGTTVSFRVPKNRHSY